MAVECAPLSMAELFNNIVIEEEVPPEWMEARLVLIKKPGKEGNQPVDFRPLCLMNSLAKVFEKLLVSRLTEEVNKKNLSNSQFGFRKGRSTLQAVKEVVRRVEEARRGSRYTRQIPLVVMLDIRNAFNNITWVKIIKAMERRGISPYLVRPIQRYIVNRKLIYYAEDGILMYKMSRGVPQGSILGPILWNLVYDDVLRITLPQGVHLIAFADDLVLVVTGKHEAEVMEAANLAVKRIIEWMTANGLRVAAEKSLVLLLAVRRVLADISVKVNERYIPTVRSAKYLGVWLDSGITFMRHTREAVEKSTKVGAALSRIMRNVRGPSTSKRKQLCDVIMSTLMYGVDA